VPPTNDAIWY